MRYLRPVLSVIALTLAASALGCDDDPSAPDGTVPLSLSVSVGTTRPIAIEDSTVVTPARGLVFEDAGHTLTVDYAAVVLGEIRLERAFGECPIAASADGSTPDCATLQSGLVLTEIPVDGLPTARLWEGFVNEGTYSELRFRIDTPDEHLMEEQLFRDLYPAFAEASVRVEGTWDGVPFVFSRDLDADLEIGLSEPVVLDESEVERNITLRLDPRAWFVDSGGRLVDPSTGRVDGPNAELVGNNIRRAFEAFEDDDLDGEDDNNEVEAP